jgi:hypothetical protein
MEILLENLWRIMGKSSKPIHWNHWNPLPRSQDASGGLPEEQFSWDDP